MRKYKYRNYPCNIQPDDRLWCVLGEDTVSRAGGVLEWAYDQQDANSVLAVMKASGEFNNLTAEPYSAFCGE
jgi:hypothetical protein